MAAIARALVGRADDVAGVVVFTTQSAHEDSRATQADPRVAVTQRFHGFKPSQVKHPGDKLHFADAMYMVINPYGMGAPSFPKYPGWHNYKSSYDLTGESTSNGTSTATSNG